MDKIENQVDLLLNAKFQTLRDLLQMAQLERPSLNGSVRQTLFGIFSNGDLLWMAQFQRPTLDGSVRDTYFGLLNLRNLLWLADLDRPSLEYSVIETYFGLLSQRDLLWMVQLERPTLDGFKLHSQLQTVALGVDPFLVQLKGKVVVMEKTLLNIISF